jgi:hypothetical protein
MGKLLLVLRACFFTACLTACTSIFKVEQIPADMYFIESKYYNRLAISQQETGKKIKAALEWQDSILKISPLNPGFAQTTIHLKESAGLKFYRRAFDIDVLTIPFKIRPSVKGFPEQLNANFSAALYLGRRFDFYRLTKTPAREQGFTLSGLGIGYGGFIGLGSVTMNPFVTQNKINYEYDGFVLTSGVAAIYDAKKFNLGLALGNDFLVDKNRENWIYQQKPWFGILFGINLN